MHTSVFICALEALPAAQGKALGTSGPDLTQYLAVCVGLIAIIAFAGWGFRRLFARAVSERAARRSLQIVDLLPLGGKQRVAVVRCYDRSFLLGLGEKELCLISELDAAAQPAAALAPTRADAATFASLLGKLRSAPAANAQPAARPAAPREGVLA